ncbi:uncharacterized protein DS421_15g489260 [Arachis hypogaea]|nr:uncharacterized protein DS421_15g489260 [Arachis hypogaea]
MKTATNIINRANNNMYNLWVLTSASNFPILQARLTLSSSTSSVAVTLPLMSSSPMLVQTNKPHPLFSLIL